MKVGDIVVADSYAGVMQVDWEDKDWYPILKERQWMCSSILHDTSFDVFSESDLRLATEEEIKEYLNQE